MDQSFAPADAIDKKRLKALSTRSDGRGLAQLVEHAALLGLTGYGVNLALGTLWLLPAMVAHGVVLVFVFAPLHEAIHRTAFRSRWLNDAVAWLCGFLLLLPPDYFRAFHFAHHRYTQDPARDPELAVAKPSSLVGYLLVVSGLPYWYRSIERTVKHTAGRVTEGFIPPRQWPAVTREARVLLLAYGVVAAASFAAGSWAVVVYWLVPALLGQPALRAYLLAEHALCPLVPDMLKNSRTTHSTAALRWLAWNMPYHTAHHAYPAVPFHALPAAHGLIADRVAVQAPGYLAVQRQIIGAANGSP
jgi:fatty acid desaturase